MAEISKKDLKKKVDELDISEDNKIELFEDIDDSMKEQDTEEITQIQIFDEKQYIIWQDLSEFLIDISIYKHCFFIKFANWKTKQRVLKYICKNIFTRKVSHRVRTLIPYQKQKDDMLNKIVGDKKKESNDKTIITAENHFENNKFQKKIKWINLRKLQKKDKLQFCDLLDK